MKKNLIIFSCFVAVFVIVGAILKNRPEPITQQQIENLGQAVDSAFQQAPSTPPPAQAQSGNSESIVAVIYRKPQSTWFIKARGLTALVEQRGGEFAQLFLNELKFNGEEPDFSHVPADYRREAGQGMRVATFDLNGLEVSVTRLSGGQDVGANIARWRNQLSLPANAPQFVKYQDNDQTVLVRLDQPAAAEDTAAAQQSAPPQAPAKEPLDSFIELSLGDNWRVENSQQGMASGTLVLNNGERDWPVAVLRLPVNVPLDTIIGIWKERIGLAANAPVEADLLDSDAGQQWQLLQLANQNVSLLIAMHKGSSRYTFMRISSNGDLPDREKAQFMDLIKTSRVIKD